MVIHGRAATLQALRVAVETGEPPETAATDNVKSPAVVFGCLRSVEAADVEGMLAAVCQEACPMGR